MKDFFEIKKGAVGLMNESAKLLADAGYEDRSERVKTALGTMDGKKMIIVTVGEIKRGKSSLINALLGEADLVPVDANVATNAITILEYAEKERVEVYFEGSETPKEITRGEIADYVSEKNNAGNYKNVETVSIYTPNEMLKKGIVLVDTPGVGSTNIAHAEATNAFLPMADLLIFTGDALSGYSETELNFLKRGYRHCKNVVFPITKKDLASNYEEIVEDDREKIHNALGIAKEEIKLIPVSSLAKLRYIENGRKTQYINSNFEEFENVLWDTVAEARVEMCIAPFLETAVDELEEAGGTIGAEYELLVSEDKQKAQNVIEELKNKKEAYAALQQEGSKWQIDVQMFAQQIKKEWQTALSDVRDEAEEYYSNEITRLDAKACQEKEYQSIFMTVNDILIDGFEKAKGKVIASIEEKCTAMISELGLDINVNTEAFEKKGFKPSDEFTVTFPKQKKIDRVGNVGRSMAISTSAWTIIGKVAGGVIGTVLLPGVGTGTGQIVGAAIGGFIGGTKGFYDGIHKYNGANVNQLKAEFARYVREQVTSMQQDGALLIDRMGVELRMQFTSSLKKRENDLKESISSMTKNAQLSPEETKKKTAKIKAKYDMFKKEIKKMKDFLALSASEKTQYGSAAAPESAQKPSGGATAYKSEQKPSDTVPQYGFLDSGF